MSVKGVVVRDSRVVLLENERAEWELPGGKLEVGESPETCLAREIAEELGLAVRPSRILDAWVYEAVDALTMPEGYKRSIASWAAEL